MGRIASVRNKAGNVISSTLTRLTFMLCFGTELAFTYAARNRFHRLVEHRGVQRPKEGRRRRVLAISDTRNLSGPGLLYRCEGACLLPPQTAPRSIETTPACS